MADTTQIVLPTDAPTLRWMDQFADVWPDIGGMGEPVRPKNLARPNQCRKYEIPKEKGVGYWEFVDFDEGFGMFINNANFHETNVLSFHGEDLIKFHFRLKARSSLYIDPIGHVELIGAACQVFYHPKGVIDYEWIEVGPVDSWISIWCTPEYLVNVLEFDLKFLPSKLASSISGDRQKPFLTHLPMSMALRQSCKDISQCRYEGALRSKYLEAQALQLLCETYAKLKTDSQEPVPNLNVQDVHAIHQAYNILQENFENPPSIVELSKSVGVNKNKLLMGFKSLFGMTIKDFSLHKRLDVAKVMLRETDKSISTIAEFVGYDHPNNFSSAFKRVYGMPPSHVRGKQLISPPVSPEELDILKPS